jgi:hypothetical protein
MMPQRRKPGLGLDHLVHALPDAQTLDGQRQFARIARHFSAPPPVTAGLLVGNASLLAQCDRYAFPRQEQCRAGADDAAADHDNVDARGQRVIRRD